jgi:NAD(P)H-flavin reductase
MAALVERQAVPLPDPRIPRLLRVRRLHRETRDTWTLDLSGLDPARGSFAPGQFAMLYAPGVGEVPISISGDPASSDAMTHTIRAVGATTRALCGLRPGDVLGWRGPYGRPWPLEEISSGADVVIVAGGIGLAPLRPAVLRLLADRARFRRIALLYGARTPGELLFRRDLERWRSRLDTEVEITVDVGDAGWRGNVGVVTTLIPPAKFDPARAVALVCGPEVMMRFTVADLRKRGVPTERIYLSLERNMHCGVGLCGRCQVGPEFICRDGPIFSYVDVERFFTMREV